VPQIHWTRQDLPIENIRDDVALGMSIVRWENLRSRER
jgi:hypothetical protein